MHDILIGFINDWSRKTKVSKVLKNLYIHKQNVKLCILMSIPLSELQVSIIIIDDSDKKSK